MVMNSAAGAGAYSAVAKVAGKALGEAGAAGAAKPSNDGMAFGDIVEAVLSNVTKSGAATEAQAATIVDGKTDVLDLVTAVAETELAVETLVTVRDRVISAYQDIINMPI